jgi:hypothetical protein
MPQTTAPVRAFGHIQAVPPVNLTRVNLLWMLYGLGAGPLWAFPDARYRAWLDSVPARAARNYFMTN